VVSVVVNALAAAIVVDELECPSSSSMIIVEPVEGVLIVFLRRDYRLKRKEASRGDTSEAQKRRGRRSEHEQGSEGKGVCGPNKSEA